MNHYVLHVLHKKFKRANQIEKLSLKTDLVHMGAKPKHFEQMKLRPVQNAENYVWNHFVGEI